MPTRPYYIYYRHIRVLSTKRYAIASIGYVFCTGNTRPQGKREEGAQHVRGDTTLPYGPRFGRGGGPAGQRGLRAPHQRHAGVRGVFRAERRAGGVWFGECLRRPAERGGEQQGGRRLGEPEPQRASSDPAGLRGRRGGGVQGEVGARPPHRSLQK